MPDPTTATVSFLKADTGVSTLVSTRVYPWELPGTPTLPAIVVTDSAGVRDAGYLPESRERQDHGGPPDTGYLAVGQTRLDVLCYGDGDFDEAKSVWLAAYEALKNLERIVHDEALLMNASRVDGPLAERDESNRTVSSGTFVVTAAEIAAT
jgi:hypothetical protein